MNVSETNGPTAIKFYLKHHWGGGKAAIAFGPDWIRTLFSMATDSSQRVIMGKNGVATFSRLFSSDHFILAGNEDMHESSGVFEVRPDPTTDYRVSCP